MATTYNDIISTVEAILNANGIAPPLTVSRQPYIHGTNPALQGDIALKLDGGRVRRYVQFDLCEYALTVAVSTRGNMTATTAAQVSWDIKDALNKNLTLIGGISITNGTITQGYCTELPNQNDNQAIDRVTAKFLIEVVETTHLPQSSMSSGSY